MSMFPLPTPWPRDPLEPIKKIIEVGKKVYDWVKGKLGQNKPITKNSSAEDINELTAIFAEYRKSVEKQAAEIEDILCEDLKSYAEDLLFLAQTDHPVFKKYRVRFQRFQRKADSFPDRMKGVVMDKVSREVSLDAPECSRVIRMLPGAEKDRAADELLRSALQKGLQAAAEKADELSRELLEEYEDAVSEAIEQLSVTSDAVAAEADRLLANPDEGDSELTLAKTESVYGALVLVESLLKEAE